MMKTNESCLDMTGIQTEGAIAVVSVSGGKDSTATAKLAIDRYGRDRVRLVFADTGHEHEITLDHITNYLPQALGVPVETVKADFSTDIARKRAYIRDKWPGKGVSAEIVERASAALHPTGIPFLDLCMMKGRFPSRMAQFCTHELKIKPIQAFMRGLVDQGFRVESWQGIRRDESRNRKDALEREWSSENGWWTERPIVDWTADEVFAFLKTSDLEANPLYRMGCSRVGCMLCINSGKDEIANAAARWPHHIDRIRQWEWLVGQACKRGYSTLLYHADGEGGDAEFAFLACNIDQMVEWSRTSRGGAQFSLLRTCEAYSGCSSPYGLCE